MRNAGYRYTLVIDANKWGQDLASVLEYGETLLENDPEKNLLFSVHMYGGWNKTEKIGIELQKAYDLSLPLVVGEFGYNFDNGKNNLNCKVDHKEMD